jgi:hypothetical protein
MLELKMAAVFSGLPAQYGGGETSYRDSRCKSNERHPSRLRVGVSVCPGTVCGWINMSAAGRGLV